MCLHKVCKVELRDKCGRERRATLQQKDRNEERTGRANEERQNPFSTIALFRHTMGQADV